MGTYLLTWLQLRWGTFRHDDRAVTAIEYGLIAALISAVIIVALTAIGGDLKGIFTTIGTALNTANTNAAAGT